MQYRNIKTGEVIFDDEAEEYVKERLGLEIKPMGRFGNITQEQTEFISEFVSWYFSGDWIEEEIEKNDVIDIKSKTTDLKYENNLDKRLGLR